jgi:outer membrane protein insertion porin family
LKWHTDRVLRHPPAASTGAQAPGWWRTPVPTLILLCLALLLTPGSADASPAGRIVPDPAGASAQPDPPETPDAPQPQDDDHPDVQEGEGIGDGELAAGEEAPEEEAPEVQEDPVDWERGRSEATERVIGQIVVDGNRRVSDSAFFNNLRLKPGDPYDERVLFDEFRRLWGLNLFDDITVEVRRGASGAQDLIFHVLDRPLIGNVAFVGMEAVTETSIRERLSQAEAEVRRGQPIDFSVLRRAEAVIERLLGESGFLQARARSRLTPVNQGQQEVTFYIREGAKTKIREIDFIGNSVYKDRTLRKMLKMTKEAFWLTSWASSKPLYHPDKFDQDAENIRNTYRGAGYLDVVIKPEVVELESDVKRHAEMDEAALAGEVVEDGGASDLEEEEDDFWEKWEEIEARRPEETEEEHRKRVEEELKARDKKDKKSKRWIYLTVPIEEGDRYQVGKIAIEGNTVLSDAQILARLPLRTGMVFSDRALKLGTKVIEEDYGARGYFYVSLNPRIEKHDYVADLTLEVTEDKKYFVDRIEFSGNTTTRDKVLRRELRLHEEDLFNVRLLRLGMRKIAQLGYWQIGDDPVVKPRADRAKVDIEVQGIESNRNEIQVGGGVSGVEGGFFQASYATRNFLGRGEILSTFVQLGSRADRYSVSFTEPWFLGKPWTLGVSLFSQQADYLGFRRIGTGGRLLLGRLLGNFSRFDVAYGFEEITFDPTDPSFGRSDVSTTSSLTTIISRDTRNNFFHPTRGTRLQTSVEYAGGFLGGDNWFVKPRVDATVYLPGLQRRHYVGLNASFGYVDGFGGREVPRFERYFLGGERSLRVFRTREVSPVRQDIDLNGNGRIDRTEDRDPNGVFDPCEDLNGNGVQDPGEFDWGNCLLDGPEDLNNNGVLDTEDSNRNGILDPGEDVNGNGVLDSEDGNGNGILDFGEDSPDGAFTPFCPTDDPNMNGIRDGASEGDFGNCQLDLGEDTNGDGDFGTVFPGGNRFVLFNAEYTIPLSSTVELALFYDAGNAFDDHEDLALDNLRVDYGLEMRFYLPVFQAPLRLIYGIIQNPRAGEDSSNFIFSIGTTF